jgi:hypothetical protein
MDGIAGRTMVRSQERWLVWSVALYIHHRVAPPPDACVGASASAHWRSVSVWATDRNTPVLAALARQKAIDEQWAGESLMWSEETPHRPVMQHKHAPELGVELSVRL